MFATASLFLFAGCEGALSTVDPAGPAARAIAALWWTMLAGSVCIFGLVMVLLAAAFGSPARAGDAALERVWIVGLGLCFTMTVLSGLLAYGLIVGERLLPRTADGAVEVRAQAQRWSWRFGYADRPGHATANVLHIPAGRPVDVAITSVDVAHSFWVPRLAGKLDAIPGHVNVLRIEADRPGRYAGLTAEYNGVGYSAHLFTVIAHDADGWRAFLEGNAP